MPTGRLSALPASRTSRRSSPETARRSSASCPPLSGGRPAPPPAGRPPHLPSRTTEDRTTMTITAPLTHANGATHPQPPPAVPLLPRGPACPWPPGDSTADTTPNADTLISELAPVAASTVSRFVSRLRMPDGDTVITWSMTAAVALVAVDAAIVSYSHIYGLATGQWGTGAETGVQARLLPLSIDGVIFEASLVKLYAARHKGIRGPRRRLRMPSLATFMLWLGIVGAVAANVTHGLPSSLLSPVAHMAIMALLSAWPAGALIGSVEMAMGLVRDKHAV